jgi:hypothetical protein
MFTDKVTASEQDIPVTTTSTTKMTRMDLLTAACDYMRNSKPTPGDETPMIEENPPPIGVKAAAAILVAMNGGKFVNDIDYDNFLREEREKIKQEERVLAARWHILFSVPQSNYNAPPILENPPEPYVPALAAILIASEPYNPYDIWTPFSEKKLEEGALKFYADLSNVGNYDKSKTIYYIANSLLENRPLTRTELILTMKCNYLSKHRAYALSVNFKFGCLMRTFRRRCGIPEDPCICSFMNDDIFT